MIPAAVMWFLLIVTPCEHLTPIPPMGICTRAVKVSTTEKACWRSIDYVDPNEDIIAFACVETTLMPEHGEWVRVR